MSRSIRTILCSCLFFTFSYTQVEPLTITSSTLETWGNFGYVGGTAGDVNNDGIPDFMVGAVGEEYISYPSGSGRVHVFSGMSDSILYILNSPYVMQIPMPTDSYGFFGSSVAIIGDINDDGCDDMAVGAYREGPGSSQQVAGPGRAYLISGIDGSTIDTLRSPTEQVDGEFGYRIAAAGDVNSDGYPDVIVGAIYENAGGPTKCGRAHLYSGKDGAYLYTLRAPVETSNSIFGMGISAAGDINKDGYDDVLVGAWNQGNAFLFSGQDGAVLYTFSNPNPAPCAFGMSVAGNFDINNDGFPDIIIGAPYDSSDGGPKSAGRAYVYSGADTSLLYKLKSPNEQEGGDFGMTVAMAGDVNADGYPDVVIGAPYEYPEGSPYMSGCAHVFSGQDATLLATLNSTHPMLGSLFSRYLGSGDLDKDGFSDVIVGATHEEEGDYYAAGHVYIFSGHDIAGLHGPILLSPGNRSEGISINPMLNWESFSGATSYQVQVATDSLFATIIIDQSSDLDTTFQIGPLSHNTTYFWRVQAKNFQTGDSEWSNARKFTTIIALPEPVILLSPSIAAEIATDSVLFIWRQVQSADSGYWFELGSDSGMTDPQIDSSLAAADTSKQLYNLNDGSYWWRVRAINAAGIGEFSAKQMFSIVTVNLVRDENLPKQFALKQNYPNPFNPNTVISYQLPVSSEVKLSIYNLLGQEVSTLVSQRQPAGFYRIKFIGHNLASGIYIYQIKAGAFHQKRKMILLK
jgi:hypothetical protein